MRTSRWIGFRVCIVAVSAFLASCRGSPDQTPTASIAVSPTSGILGGQQVTLDGSGSTGPQSDPLT